MSRYDWEEGTILLPSAEVAGLKQALREWANKFHADVRAEAVRLHKAELGGTRSQRVYTERLRAAYSQTRGRSAVRTAALGVLEQILRDAQAGRGTLHQPTVADVERRAQRATNRTTRFTVADTEGYECAYITIEGRTLTWQVPESNHAVERAHEAPLARILFTRLARVTWTRGTGGYLVGNDEYNRDNDDFGGGANYLTSTYGPKGRDARTDDYMARGFSLKRARELAAHH